MLVKEIASGSGSPLPHRLAPKSMFREVASDFHPCRSCAFRAFLVKSAAYVLSSGTTIPLEFTKCTFPFPKKMKGRFMQFEKPSLIVAKIQFQSHFLRREI